MNCVESGCACETFFREQFSVEAVKEDFRGFSLRALAQVGDNETCSSPLVSDPLYFAFLGLVIDDRIAVMSNVVPDRILEGLAGMMQRDDIPEIIKHRRA